MRAKDYRPTITYGGHDRHDRVHAARQPAVDPQKEDHRFSDSRPGRGRADTSIATSTTQLATAAWAARSLDERGPVVHGVNCDLVGSEAT
jgi:hypothetical protein